MTGWNRFPVVVFLCLGMAWHDGAVGAVIVYGVDTVSRDLVTIDPRTGIILTVGPTGLDFPVDALAYDSASRTMFGHREGTKALVSLDLATGDASVIASLPNLDIDDFAYESATGRLFANRQSAACCQDRSLVTIDRGNGNATVVGPFPASSNVSALAFGPAGLFYGIDTSLNGPSALDNEATLVSIDPIDASVAFIASLGIGSYTGMTYHSELGRLLVTDVARSRMALVDLADPSTLSFVDYTGGRTIAGIAAVAVPAPGSASLLGLLMLVAIAGGLRRRGG